MAAIPVQLSEAMPLHAQLGSKETGKFVRAILRDADGGAIAGSPITLSEDSDGMYSTNSFNMPNEQFVIAQYLVFDDAGFTTEHDGDDAGVDIFYLADESQAPVRKDRVFGVVQTQNLISGFIRSDKVVASIKQMGTSGVVMGDGQVSGALKQQTIQGVVDCD